MGARIRAAYRGGCPSSSIAALVCTGHATLFRDARTVLRDAEICRGGFQTRPRAATEAQATGPRLRIQGGFETRPYQKALAPVSLKNKSDASAVEGGRKLSLRRLAPLIIIACLSVFVLAMGWQRQISFKSWRAITTPCAASLPRIKPRRWQATSFFTSRWRGSRFRLEPISPSSAGFYSARSSAALPPSSARASARSSSFALPGARLASSSCARRDQRRRRPRRAFARTRSAICCSCVSCRYFPSGSSISSRRSVGCG